MGAMNRYDTRFEIKELTDAGRFTGYGSVYGVVDQMDDIIQSGAFAESLAAHQAKGTLPALLWQHRAGEPIGAYTAMREDAAGLFVQGQIALKTQRGAEAYELLQMKAVSGLSVGFMCREDNYDQKTGVRTIKRADLMEVSLVTFPANEAARVSMVKSIDELPDLKSVERLLRESGGMSRSEATALLARIKRLQQQSDSVNGAAVKQFAATARRLAFNFTKGI